MSIRTGRRREPAGVGAAHFRRETGRGGGERGAGGGDDVDAGQGVPGRVRTGRESVRRSATATATGGGGVSLTDVADQGGLGLRLGRNGQGEGAGEREQRRGGEHPGRGEEPAPRDLPVETGPAGGGCLRRWAAAPPQRPAVRRRWRAAPRPRPRRSQGLGGSAGRRLDGARETRQSAGGRCGICMRRGTAAPAGRPAVRRRWRVGLPPRPRRSQGARRSALGARRSALGARRSALGARRSALGARRSALGARRSALGIVRQAGAICNVNPLSLLSTTTITFSPLI